MAADDTQRAQKAHEGTYNAFTGLMKWGGIGFFVIAFIVILIISN
jgi:hypothetical protein